MNAHKTKSSANRTTDNTRPMEAAVRTSPDSIGRYELPSALLHDLRTPLNQIIGYTEMLTEQAYEDGQPGFVPVSKRNLRTTTR